MSILSHDDPRLSAQERHLATILVIETEVLTLTSFRTSLGVLGFGSVLTVTDHAAGLKLIQERPITHVLFTSETTTHSAAEFLSCAMKLDSHMITIATSNNLVVDHVFELLRLGARGVLLKPASSEGLDMVICAATAGPTFSRVVLDARDRNEAFSALVAASLDKFADAQRLTLQKRLSSENLDLYRTELHNLLRLAEGFAEGGEAVLYPRMYQLLTDLSNGPATRLGRLRKRLAEKRQSLDHVSGANAEIVPGDKK